MANRMFEELCEDETPMVRRAACSQFGKLIEVVSGKGSVDLSFANSAT